MIVHTPPNPAWLTGAKSNNFGESVPKVCQLPKEPRGRTDVLLASGDGRQYD